MSNNLALVSQYEIARQVAVALMDQDSSLTNKQTVTGTVVKLIATFAKFVTHFFKKIDKNNTITCEVPNLGNFVLERDDNEQLKYSFVPSTMMMNESFMTASRKSVVINKLREPIMAKQLSIDKLAQLSGMDVEAANRMQIQLIKTISKNLKSQNSVALDLKFGNGNYMVITQNEGTTFQSKINIIESYSQYASTVPSIQARSNHGGFRSMSQVRARDNGENISDVKSVIHGKLSEFATPRDMASQKSSQGFRTRNSNRRVLSIGLAKTVGKQNKHLSSQVDNMDYQNDNISQKSIQSRGSQFSKKSQSFASMMKNKLQQTHSRQPSKIDDIFSEKRGSQFKNKTQEFAGENRTRSMISNYSNNRAKPQPFLKEPLQEDQLSRYSAFQHPPKSAKSTTSRKLPSTTRSGLKAHTYGADRNLQNSNHKKRLEQLLQVNANTSHQWRKDREVELYQSGLGDEVNREEDEKSNLSRNKYFTKTLKERFNAIRERARLDPAEPPTQWERGMKGAPPVDINKRTKDLGLMAHALFYHDGPVNHYTKDCDTHYKVQYLLLKRDLQGQAVQGDAAQRLEDKKASLKDDVVREKKEFYDQIEHHKMLTHLKQQQHRDTQKNYRDFWSQQIQDRQEKEFQDRIDDMFAPNGSPMAYNFKSEKEAYESQMGTRQASPSKDYQESKPSARGDTSSRRPKTQESARSKINKVNINSFRPLHKFGEFIPPGNYAYPIQDGDRTTSQLERDTLTKQQARAGLLEQMKYNKLRNGIEREQELIFGQQMVANAQNSLKGEAEFLKVKRDAATKTMRDQWTAVQNNIEDHKNINKIFE